MKRDSCDFGAKNNSAYRPYIWQASNGPLFIRSKWMDNQGYRHFILNSEWTTKRKSKTIKPKLLDNNQYRTLQRDFQSGSITNQQKDFHPTQVPFKQLPHRKLCRHILDSAKNRTSVDILKRHLENSIKGAKETKAESELKETKQLELILNSEENSQLTERVLQWLDLAGKVQNYDINLDNIPHDKTNSNRRISTAIPSSNKKFDPLRRTESIHHLSLTLNEEELAKSSRNRKDNSNPFPIPYLCARKLRQMSSNKSAKQATTASPQTSSNGGAAAATHKTGLLSPKSTTSSTSTTSSPANVTTSRNSKHRKSIGKLGKTESIENQYRTMIQRQLLETCNTQYAKKQLHIFMPNMPSNKYQNSSQPDCESCLNSISDISKT